MTDVFRFTRFARISGNSTWNRLKYAASNMRCISSFGVSSDGIGIEMRCVCPINCISAPCKIRVSSNAIVSLSIRRWPSAICSAKTSQISFISMLSRGRFTVRTKSWRISATTQPSAFVIPGRAGTKMRGILNSRPSDAACSGPAPPKAKSVKSRGSYPFDIETILNAPAILSLATRMIAPAAWSTSIPSGSAILSCKIARILSMEGVSEVESSFSALRRPKTRLASVIVGFSPPRP